MQKATQLSVMMLFAILTIQAQNIGIGTSNPQEKLHVSGTILADDLKLPNGAADGLLLHSDADGRAEWAPLVDSTYWPAPSVAITDRISAGSAAIAIAVEGSYAYVIDQAVSQLRVIDVTHENAPLLSGTLNIGAEEAVLEDVAVNGKHVYVVDSGSEALHVIQVNDPENPVLKGSLILGGDSGAEPVAVAVLGTYAYVTDQFSDDLKVIDVSSSTNPLLAGSVAVGNNPRAVAVQGSYAYVLASDATGDGLWIIDISNPGSPVTTDSLLIGLGNAVDLAVDGNYAYVLHDFLANELKIVDVSNPADPFFITSMDLSFDPVAIAVAGDYVYVIGLSHFMVTDIGNASNPVLVDSLVGATIFGSYAIAVSGNYAYVLESVFDEMIIIRLSYALVGVDGHGNVIRIDEQVFWRRSGDHLSNFNPGNVGIGMPSGIIPEAKLHVEGNEGASLSSDGYAMFGTKSGHNIILDNFGIMSRNNSAASSLLINQYGGNVGIGLANPTETLHVGGNILATGTITQSSDFRYKTNFEPIGNVLADLSQLHGTYYDYQIEQFPENKFPQGRQIGIIAQELESVYPELVLTGPHGFKSVNYSCLTAILLEGINELALINNALKEQLDEQNEKLQSFHQRLEALEHTAGAESVDR